MEVLGKRVPLDVAANLMSATISTTQVILPAGLPKFASKAAKQWLFDLGGVLSAFSDTVNFPDDGTTGELLRVLERNGRQRD